ncbi:MAG: carbohydrate binding domain-containing protein [Planctomycetes bacterium]|nr:carbohydrate binding domain-containing protein [Planctomycetota bacterium]
MKKTFTKAVIAAIVFSLVTGTAYLPGPNMPEAAAAANLIKENSFEGDLFSYWSFWQSPENSRTYQFYRSYDAPFGNGSYSAAIDAAGAPSGPFTALLSTKNTNKFNVETGKSYYLFFYAKATTPMDVLAYLQRASDYDPVSLFLGRRVTTSWQRYSVTFTPSASTDAFLAFTLGDMPANASFYLDGVQLFEANQVITTNEIRGYVGETNKLVKISNIENFSLTDFGIELPYYDNLTGQATTKLFPARSLTTGGIYFDLPEQTFGGIARVFANDTYIGSFNYNIQTKVTEFYPSLIRANDDLAVSGSGFNPLANTTFLVVNYTDLDGKVSQTWIAPTAMDSKLKEMVFRLPYGVVAGNLYIQTSFMNMAGTEVVNKSNLLKYSVKPVVFAGGIEWRDRGYEQVGDTVLIHGKGFSYSPTVNFYDDNGVKVDSKKAKLIQITDHEVIEVQTSGKYNNLNVTVMAGGVESDLSSALMYLAKPKVNKIATKYSRPMYNTAEKIPAAKVGDLITISGEGFKPNASSTTQVEFQGINSRLTVVVENSAIDSAGKNLKVTVPSGAQNGYIGVRANNEISNYLPLEIIPTVISISPDPLVPGQEMTITAEGMGNNLALAKVNFQTDKAGEVTVAPSAIVFNGNLAQVRLQAPLALSNNSTKVSLQYDRWRDSGSSVLNITPTITGASIDMDTRILAIRGFGFSINPKENQITYKYADQNRTVINPKVRLLGVYPTEEGQEIRVQILDDYYFGYVSVKVGDFTSNEANFGPVAIRKIVRRVEYVPSAGQVMGVLYISGYNFGTQGGVMVGTRWATVHYRSEFYIIAVVDQAYVYDNPVIVARE